MCIIYTLAAVPSSRNVYLVCIFWVAREAAGTFVTADPKVGPIYGHFADMKSAALPTAIPPGMARPEGFEPSTCGLKVRCSTGLSYGRDGGRLNIWWACMPGQ